MVTTILRIHEVIKTKIVDMEEPGKYIQYFLIDYLVQLIKKLQYENGQHGTESSSIVSFRQWLGKR